MIKVTLTTPEGRTTGLYPEKASLQEVLGYYHTAEYVNTVNGAYVRERDMDTCLREYSKDGEVFINSYPNSDKPLDPPSEPLAVQVDASNADLYLALCKVREALDAAMKLLEKEVDGLPF